MGKGTRKEGLVRGTFELGGSKTALVDEFYWVRSDELGYVHTASANWSFEPRPTLEALETLAPEGAKVELARSFQIPKEHLAWCLEVPGEAVIDLVWHESHSALNVSVNAALPEKAQHYLDKLMHLLPPTQVDVVETPDEVIVSFWFDDPQRGPTSLDRKLNAPSWAEIESNYPGQVRSQLSGVMDPSWRPTAEGRLMLWQGEPGTGKTFALRALARSWRDWCEVFYVTDPERFLGMSTYMLKVLLSSDYNDEDRWKLVILEDSGELLAKNAKSTTGQAISRLLNCADGLIGQGLNVMTLITTNEELGALHEAVSRPGRCLPPVRFAPFTNQEAASWLRSRGVKTPPRQAHKLAELYSVLRGDNRPVIAERAVGFNRDSIASDSAPAGAEAGAQSSAQDRAEEIVASVVGE